MTQLAFAPYDLIEPCQLAGGADVELDDFVECFGDASGLAGPFFGQADITVAALQGNERSQNLAGFAVERGRVAVLFPGTGSRALDFRSPRGLTGRGWALEYMHGVS